MKYFARCIDRNLNEIVLTCKKDTPEEAVAYLKERYLVRQVTFLSTTPIVERERRSYYGRTALVVKASVRHAGRVARGVGES